MLFISDKAVLKNGDVVIRTDNFTQTSFTNTGTKTAKILASQDGITYKQILSLSVKQTKEVTDNYSFYKLQGDTEVYVFSNTPSINPSNELTSLLERVTKLENQTTTSTPTFTKVDKAIAQYNLVVTGKFIELDGLYLPLYDLERVVFEPKETKLVMTFMQNEQARIRLSDLVIPIQGKELDRSLWQSSTYVIKNGYLIIDTKNKSTVYLSLTHPDLNNSISIEIKVVEPYSIQEYLDSIHVEVTPKDDGYYSLQMIADVPLPSKITFSSFTIEHDGRVTTFTAFNKLVETSYMQLYASGEIYPTSLICEDQFYTYSHNPFSSISVTHNGKTYTRNF